MLATILIALGLAPAGAETDPCLLPVWATPEPVAISCDLKEAAFLGQFGKKNRTGLLFKRSARSPAGLSLVYATTSSGKNSESAALLVGSYGGVVTAHGKVAGIGWTSDLKSFGLDPDSIPVGAVVSLVQTTGPAR